MTAVAKTAVAITLVTVTAVVVTAVTMKAVVMTNVTMTATAVAITAVAAELVVRAVLRTKKMVLKLQWQPQVVPKFTTTDRMVKLTLHFVVEFMANMFTVSGMTSSGQIF